MFFQLAVILLVGIQLLAANSRSVLGQEDAAQSLGADQVAAIVGGWSISVARVQRHLASTIGHRKVPQAALDRVRAEALEHLVRRQVVLDYINEGHRAGESEIRSAISIMETNLAKVDQTIEDHLKRTSQTREELENEIGWKIAWQRYLDRKLTVETLSSYFQNNSRIFDGTEMRVAHILFENSDSTNQPLIQAHEVRSQITEGKISWEDAVKKHSRATESKKKAGEIGWIRYSEPMPTVFNDAAFKLETGQISQPMRTKFGVHLIKCIEINPGKIGPRDAEDQVRQHATRALFDRIADHHRSEVTIAYTRNWPNLEQLRTKPGK